MKSIAFILLLGSVGWGQVTSLEVGDGTSRVLVECSVNPKTKKIIHCDYKNHGTLEEVVSSLTKTIEDVSEHNTHLTEGVITLKSVKIPTDIKYCDQISVGGPGEECVMHKGDSFLVCSAGLHFESKSPLSCVKNSK